MFLKNMKNFKNRQKSYEKLISSSQESTMIKLLPYLFQFFYFSFFEALKSKLRHTNGQQT